MSQNMKLEMLLERLRNGNLSADIIIALGDDAGRVVWGEVDGLWVEDDAVCLQARSEQRLDCLSFEEADEDEDDLEEVDVE